MNTLSPVNPIDGVPRKIQSNTKIAKQVFNLREKFVRRSTGISSFGIEPPMIKVTIDGSDV
jgi:hypothetical protein